MYSAIISVAEFLFDFGHFRLILCRYQTFLPKKIVCEDKVGIRGEFEIRFLK
ncbi:MAG: hypothetical protein FD181_1782 [Prolixibacteraceae bacterium]|nr:MAG: hypothetical protein FD181_1782 [Prolixibacteraceae bacterium]